MPAYLGHGVGLRRDHYQDVLAGPRRCDWFEVISENFMEVGGRPRAVLMAVREEYPVVLHGVSLSIGSTDPIGVGYLRALKQLIADLEPAWVSDHLCWTGVGGHNAHDLLPVPYTEEALAHVIERVRRVQDALGRRIALENASSYVGYRVSQMPEWEFLARLAEGADCGILLDVNNVFVAAHNHGFDPRTYLAAVPVGRVWQFHLAGHSTVGPLLLDTHDHAVPAPVWELYREAVRRFGPVSSLIEWDERIPPYLDVIAQRDKAAAVAAEVLGREVPPEGSGRRQADDARTLPVARSAP